MIPVVVNGGLNDCCPVSRIIHQERCGLQWAVASDIIVCPLGEIKCPSVTALRGSIFGVGLCMRQRYKGYVCLAFFV